MASAVSLRGGIWWHDRRDGGCGRIGPIGNCGVRSRRPNPACRGAGPRPIHPRHDHRRSEQRLRRDPGDPGRTYHRRAYLPPRGCRGLIVGLIVAILVTLVFDYFGRPPLVIQGDYNAQVGDMHGVKSFSLGEPRWGFGQVTYPITLETTQGVTEPPNANAVMNCKGSITLDWGWLGGWNSASSSWSCGG